MDSPCFDARPSIFEDPSESKGYPFGNLNLSTGPSISGTHNLASPAGAQSSSEHMYLSHEAPSPSSGIWSVLFLFTSTEPNFDCLLH